MKRNVIMTQFNSGVVAHEKLGPMSIEHYNNFLNNSTWDRRLILNECFGNKSYE